jgi:hypothetical protein
MALTILVGIIFVSACEPSENISDIPEIHFKSLSGPFIVQTGTVTYYGARLNFSFSDGNSDFGVDVYSNPSDTINFFMVPFQKLNGAYDSVSMETYGRKYTIKKDDMLDRNGQAVKGEISVEIQYILLPPFDTMKYEFYIMDRAGNKSNIESTSDIPF